MRVCTPGSGIGPRGSGRPSWPAVAAALAVAGLAGCVTTGPTAPAATGAAGGSTAVGADSSLQTCGEPVGTVRLQDGMANTSAPAAARPGGNDNAAGIQALLAGLGALGQARAQAPAGGGEGGASLDSLRLLIQQSNCFVIVDRGLVEAAADDEKRRTRNNANEVRDDANMGPGQEVAADFVLRSSVVSMGTTDSKGVNLGFLSKIAGTASVGRTVTEAKVQLVLSDIRSKVQVAAAQGEGSGSNTGLATNVLGRAGKGLGGIGVKSESNTSGTTILLQAFADAYNKMVPAVQNYKAQQVRGGLGTGGTLRVQGSRPEASAGPK